MLIIVIYAMIKSMSIEIIFMTEVLAYLVMLLFTCYVAFDFVSPLVSEAVSVWNKVVLVFVCKVALEVVELL